MKRTKLQTRIFCLIVAILVTFCMNGYQVQNQERTYAILPEKVEINKKKGQIKNPGKAGKKFNSIGISNNVVGKTCKAKTLD